MSGCRDLTDHVGLERIAPTESCGGASEDIDRIAPVLIGLWVGRYICLIAKRLNCRQVFAIISKIISEFVEINSQSSVVLSVVTFFFGREVEQRELGEVIKGRGFK